MTKGGNGSGKPVAVSAEDAWLEAAAGALYQSLHQLYPLEDQQKLANVAMFVAREQAKITPVVEAYKTGEHTHVELTLVEPRTVYVPGAKLTGLKLQSHMRIEKCKSLDEVMKSATIFAILVSPLAQALLALHGYKFSVGLGSAVLSSAADKPLKT